MKVYQKLKSAGKVINIYLQRKYNGLSHKEIGSFSIDLKFKYIVASKKGLFFLKDKKIFKLLTGEFYGVTFYKEDVYVFEKFNRKGRILKFNKNLKNNLKVFITGLSKGCHQIDFIGDKLFITDTYNNRINEFDLNGTLVKSFYPLGKLKNGRLSKNYGHINSIFFKNNHFYLMCHNETIKTERNSEILKCDKSFNVLNKIQTGAKNAHNILILNNEMFYCDSYNFSLKKNHRAIIKTEYFTRGLSITKENILFGCSEIAKREKRTKAKGAVYILDKNESVLEIIKIPAMVQEIRCIDVKDFSLSNNKNNN